MSAAKQNYRVRSKLEVFYTGGSAQLSADGRLLACACADEVKLVDVASGTILKTLPGDSEPVTSLALSPDARLLFAASRSLQLRCWSLENGQAVRSYKGHKAPVADMAVDATGGLLATSSADRTVRVWDVDGGFCTHSFTGHSGVVLRVLFHPRQLMLVSAGDDGEVRVWDLVTKSCAAVLKGHFSAVTSLSLSPDGWTLLSGGRDSVVTVWSMRDYSKIATVPVYEALEGLAYLPPGTAFPGLPSSSSSSKKAAKGAPPPVCFATGGEKGKICLWRADTGKCVYEQPDSAAATSSAAGGIVEVTLLPGAVGLLTATQDCRLLFHRPAGADLAVHRQLIGNNDEVTDMQFITLGSSSSSQGGSKGEQEPGAAAAGGLPTHLVVSTNSDQIRIFDAVSMSCTATLTGHTDTVLALDALHLASGTTLLASAGKDASVRLWNLPSARCVGVGAGHVSAVSCVAFARRGGNFLASGGTDKLLKVWDTKALKLDADSPAKLRVTAAVAAHDKDINAVAVAPNDSVICTGSQDRTAKVWKLPDLVLSLTLKGHKRGIWAVAFSPVDQAVATASGDKSIRLWSLGDGSCLRTFEGHQASVLRLNFLSAGTQLVSSGADGHIKLWSVRLSECINTFDAHDDKVWALSSSGPSGDLLATGGGDGAIAVWEDCTAADADEVAELAEQAVLKGQDLANALKDSDFERASSLAFEMRHPGRLLAVVRQAMEQGQAKGRRIMGQLAAAMGPEELRQCLEYCREWNVNAKNCHVAQAMLQAVLRQLRPQELLAVPGLSSILEGLLPYSQRHFARADRLLRSTYLCDYILGAMGGLQPADGDAVLGGQPGHGPLAAAAARGQQQGGVAPLVGQQQPQALPRPVRALLHGGGAVPMQAPAAAAELAPAAAVNGAAEIDAVEADASTGSGQQEQDAGQLDGRSIGQAEPQANGAAGASSDGASDGGTSRSDDEQQLPEPKSGKRAAPGTASKAATLRTAPKPGKAATPPRTAVKAAGTAVKRGPPATAAKAAKAGKQQPKKMRRVST